MSPGYETPAIIAACEQADKRIREYAAKNQLPQYTEGTHWVMGPTPLVLMLDALIRDRDHLHEMLNLVLENRK
jgi:hypothetical protein